MYIQKLCLADRPMLYLVIYIRWSESHRKTVYTAKSLINWKRANDAWKSLDQYLEFMNVRKVIKKFLDENEGTSMDLTKFKMKNNPNFSMDIMKKLNLKNIQML